MIGVINYAMWMAPLLVLVVSLIAFRFLPFKQLRYSLYGIILFIVFILDLLKISFVDDRIDRIAQFMILFMIFEFVFYFLSIKNRKAGLTVVIFSLTVYLISFSQWLMLGTKNECLWKSTTVSSHDHTDGTYLIKERKKETKKIRKFILSRKVSSLLFEKYMHSYSTLDGYYLTDFKYKWKIGPDGLLVDLIDGDVVVWSLGKINY